MILINYLNIKNSNDNNNCGVDCCRRDERSDSDAAETEGGAGGGETVSDTC